MAISELSKSVKLPQASASNKCQHLFLFSNLYLTESLVHQPAAAGGANAKKGFCSTYRVIGGLFCAIISRWLFTFPIRYSYNGEEEVTFSRMIL